MQQVFAELVERLKGAFGDNLVSAILYGSAVTGDWNERSSDFNVLCVLSRITVRELEASEPVLKWWREKGNFSPLLMTREEVRLSTDCFPMEFQDMKAHRHVLYGEDVITDIVIDRSFYRAQIEHELRSKVLRLRQKAAELFLRPDALLRLQTDSLSTFCVIARHALILKGLEPKWHKREIIAKLEEVLSTPLPGLHKVADYRSAAKESGWEGIGKAEAVSLFEAYLKEVETLARFVDGIDK